MAMITTADFRHTMEKHAGMDLGWFFEAWVDGIEVPRYGYAWRALEAGGKHQVELRIRQKQARPMKMIVPVKLEFGPESAAVTRLVVEERDKVSTFAVPARVREPELNPFDAVLCETEKERL